MAGVDPYATFRISLQAKVSNNLPLGFQDPTFAPLNTKIFAPENVSQLAIWDSQANPTAAITAWVTPVQAAPAGESRAFFILFLFSFYSLYILYILVAVSPGLLWGSMGLSGSSSHSGG